MDVIRQISAVIESVEGIKLLDVDPGKATNRTVITFAGEPEKVVEAAFRAVKLASILIDMSVHHGEHPRLGATDVCPLIPVSGITMEETVVYARKLAERIGTELPIPVYCYENAAYNPERKNLANIRDGEYEGLPAKLRNPVWKPDFGPAVFNPKTGATAVGARDFLVAYNINLNTTSVRLANAIAFDIREKGRLQREGGKLSGRIIKDDDGNPVYMPGTLKSIKAIGWYIQEYGIAQVSINLTDLSVTSVHKAFDETCKKAEKRGVRVTGSELVGLIPLQPMLDAGRHYLKKQKRSVGVSDKELIKIAVKSMGMADLRPFVPEEKIIEYRIRDRSEKLLTRMSLEEFMNETASESPAPGGGSVSAYLGSLGVALGTMVANLSSHKRGWDDRWEEFSHWAEKGKELQEQLLALVDEDTHAFKAILRASGLPKRTDEEKTTRQKAIREATRNAIEVPLKVMQTAFRGFEIIRAMVDTGNPNSISDAGVGAAAIRSCILGAWLNVQINASGTEDEDQMDELISSAKELVKKTEKIEKEILQIVEAKIKSWI